MKILLAGATGLVGQALLRKLDASADVSRIDVISRRPVGVSGPKIVNHVGESEAWPALVASTSPDAAMCTLGTTIKTAGSEEAFFAVDHDMVVSFARAARGAGARRFLMVSSVGAHAASRNFYLGTKGKAEGAVVAVGFERVDVFRPGLLRGNRGGELRIGERIGIFLSPLTDVLTPRVLDHFRSIAADDVAAAMVAMLGVDEPGNHVHENRAMLGAIASLQSGHKPL